MIKRLRNEIVTDCADYFRAWRGVLRDYRWFVLLAALLIVLLGIALIPYDHPLRQTVQKNIRPDLKQIAHYFRKWGDFRDTVTVTLLIFASGWAFKRRNWRRLAVAFFLSASLAGIGVNILRFTTGRPRPHLETADRFYGPFMIFKSRDERPGRAKIYAMQSFPSGHSGTSGGAAAMLLIAAPPIGIPMALSAAGVIWSCIYQDKHYLTDVTVGAGIGLIFGTLGGLAYRRMRFTGDNTPEVS